MEPPFLKISLGMLFISLLVVWLRSFFLSGFKRTSFYTANEGWLAGLSFRLFLSISILAICVYLLKEELMQWSAMTLPLLMRYAGIPIGVFGLIILAWSIRALGPNFHASLKLREGHQLITHGPYKYARHPMYLSFILFWISFFLLSANWFIGITGMLTYVIIFVWRVPREEKMMKDEFGDV